MTSIDETSAGTPVEDTCCDVPPVPGPDPRPIDDDDADTELADLARALAHPARVRIVRHLSARNSCVCGELVDLLPLAQSTVSQHLKVLREAGLIVGGGKGPGAGYCVDPGVLRRLRVLVSAL